MAGKATILVERLKPNQQPKVGDIRRYVAEHLDGFEMAGSAAEGGLSISGPAGSGGDAADIAKQIWGAVPPTPNPLGQELAIPDISPKQIRWTWEPEGGGPTEHGALVM